MTMNNIIRTKCIVAGDSTVGKSAIVQSFLTEGSQFPKNYNMTLGVDIQTRLINVPDTSYSVELYLYDFSGKEFYRDLVLKMSSQPSLVFMVYDATSESSFKKVVDIYTQIKEETKMSSLKGVLFANKTDLTTRRLVSPKAGRDLSQSLGLVYFEGSAKDHAGVDEPFFYLVNEWFKMYTDKTQSFKLLS
ncbi:LOW QUALITY PROTEIN: intraflagellar transport protein 27 homolog [Penaeus monodon]|uniref:LOW QUALITY PROTEIN: intraflagellar transport protein 27 homolog n=1 Tax=Penaeus monodon TaxID=6687 RepID=UPI0018A7BADF|nr:LOW QUALITY PROTEIN: intraflagellar transport protein 27 homolog [Penaeus monodon]